MSFGGTEQQQTGGLNITGRQQFLRPPEKTCDFIGIDFPHRRLRACGTRRRSWGCYGLLLWWRWRGGGAGSHRCGAGGRLDGADGRRDSADERRDSADGRRGCPGQPDDAADQRSPVRATKLSGQIHHADKVGRWNDRYVRDLLRRHAPFAGAHAPADRQAGTGRHSADCDRRAGTGGVDVDTKRQRLIDGSVAVADHQRRSGLALRHWKQR